MYFITIYNEPKWVKVMHCWNELFWAHSMKKRIDLSIWDDYIFNSTKTPMDNIIKNPATCNDWNDKIHFQIQFKINFYYVLIEIAYFCYKKIEYYTLYCYGEDMSKPCNEYHILKLFYCMKNFFIATFNNT